MTSLPTHESLMHPFVTARGGYTQLHMCFTLAPPAKVAPRSLRGSGYAAHDGGEPTCPAACRLHVSRSFCNAWATAGRPETVPLWAWRFGRAARRAIARRLWPKSVPGRPLGGSATDAFLLGPDASPERDALVFAAHSTSTAQPTGRCCHPCFRVARSGCATGLARCNRLARAAGAGRDEP